MKALNYTGLLPGRAGDTLGIGLAWARLSGEIVRAERAAGAAVILACGLAVEMSYTLIGGKRWRVVPDLQWIRHPGGPGALADALGLGLRTRVES